MEVTVCFMNVLIANIFSGLGALLLAYSTFSKDKERMLWIQVGDCACCVFGNAFIGSMSAMSTSLICTVRNILNAKGRLSQGLSYIFAIIIFLIGVIVNNRGLIGILPLIASVEYTVWSAKGKTPQSLRYALLTNLCLWFIHDLVVRLYPAMIMDIVVSGVTLVNILKYRKVE